ncbi:MAG: ABC transporter permease [Lentisphaeria bacterium]|nr:ABC transporter permease [Lentisphaeria bacterium]
MSEKTAQLSFQPAAPPDQGGTVVFAGEWCLDAGKNGIRDALAGVRDLTNGPLVCAGDAIQDWDTTLVAMIVRLKRLCAGKNMAFEPGSLPGGVVRLADLAMAVPERDGAGRKHEKKSPLTRLGEAVLAAGAGGKDMVTFLGELTVSFGRLVAGRAQMQWGDVVRVIEETGPRAFPIVGLIAGLMGIILAFVGAVQLRVFGAEIYVADLVAIGIVREMGAIMTGIVMAGRTGASYAARIGSMQVNEEIDAFTTMGISPVDFLVLPRTIGLVLMMPLLVIYANVIGMLGGMFIGVFMLDISPVLYLQQTRSALGLNHLAVGLVMSVIFGVLVAFFGCLRGLRCGRSAESVGEGVTSAVVSGIVSIVIATALVTVAADILGF